MITKEEARQRWIEALESGKYPQTKDHLHDDMGYCCLGVACDLFAKELGIERKWIEHGQIELFSDLQSVMPESVVTFLDLNDNCGGAYPKLDNSLVCLNDSGKTFEEIAAALKTGDYWKE